MNYSELFRLHQIFMKQFHEYSKERDQIDDAYFTACRFIDTVMEKASKNANLCVKFGHYLTNGSTILLREIMHESTDYEFSNLAHSNAVERIDSVFAKYFSN